MCQAYRQGALEPVNVKPNRLERKSLGERETNLSQWLERLAGERFENPCKSFDKARQSA
jgi:hypothetical protein